MTGFLLAEAMGVAVVLTMLLWPLLRKGARLQSPSRGLHAEICREQLAELEQDLAEGTLGREHFAQARAELLRRATQETRQEDAAGAAARSRTTLAAVGLLVPAAAAALYLMLGNPAGITQRGAQPTVGGNAQIGRMVASLEQKLQKEPGNLKGWAMLARSYKAMGRTSEAEKAFDRAAPLLAKDAQMLASYAEIAASNRGGALAGKPTMLIQKALLADPDNLLALSLSGAAQLQAGQHEHALQTWERLAARLPPGSDDARSVQQAIESLRARAASSPGRQAGVATGR